MSWRDGKTEQPAVRYGLRRWYMGLNGVGAILLGALVVVLVNVIVWRVLPRTWGLDVRARHQLSEKTQNMLAGQQGPLEIIALVDAEDRLYDDVRQLLSEYQHVATALPDLAFSLELVDPSRDIARTRQLAQEFALESGNQILFRSGESERIIDVGNLAQYEIEVREDGMARRMVGFLGEQAFSSAILSVMEEETPVVYFLTGHGERDIDDFHPQNGFSALARIISRDNFDVRRLDMSTYKGVPADCQVLVVAGPDQQLSEEELRWIESYLQDRHGRLLLMLDPQVEVGLSPLLEKWNVYAASGYVAGRTFTGRELLVTHYGDHPITRSFRNMTTMFFLPRPVLPLTPKGAHAGNGDFVDEDRIRVSILAQTGDEGWIESDVSQQPPVWDESQEKRGSIPVALAVERGAISIDAQLPPTRLVVLGDSFFVSNAAVASGVGGNISLCMSALHWLAERDALLTVAPRVPYLLQPACNRAIWRRLLLALVFVFPAGLVLVGAVVGILRRR